MKDIVERLYDLSERFIFQGGSEFARSLADEIMALRTKAGNWENVFGHLGPPDEVGNEWIALKVKYDALWRDFKDVEGERQDICLLLKHAANSATPVKRIVEQLVAQLEASQAREAQLREAITAHEKECKTSSGWTMYYDATLHRVLAFPTDDTALKARLKAERERVAFEFGQSGQLVISDRIYVVNFIRNLGDE